MRLVRIQSSAKQRRGVINKHERNSESQPSDRLCRKRGRQNVAWLNYQNHFASALIINKLLRTQKNNRNSKRSNVEPCNNVWWASDLNHRNPNVFLITFCAHIYKMRKHIWAKLKRRTKKRCWTAKTRVKTFSHPSSRKKTPRTYKKSGPRTKAQFFLSNFLFCCVHVFLDG